MVVGATPPHPYVLPEKLSPCAVRQPQDKALRAIKVRGEGATVSQKCGNCDSEVPPSGTRCPVCQEPVGYPNVRAALLEDEREALAHRVKAAQDSAVARRVVPDLQRFEAEVSQSKAVMSRTLGALSSWVNNESPLFQSFHQQLKHLGRTPSFSVYDQQRASAESTINPFNFQDINFCALTINELGMDRYGPYSVLLSENMIKHRSSVFEENPFIFNDRHNVVSGTNPPKGYRAVWSNRHNLAVAKLFPEINAGMTSAEFASILIKQIGDGAKNDYIEVHVHGPIHRHSISKVSGSEPSNRVDKAVWKQSVKSLRKLGASVEILK